MTEAATLQLAGLQSAEEFLHAHKAETHFGSHRFLRLKFCANAPQEVKTVLNSLFHSSSELFDIVVVSGLE